MFLFRNTEDVMNLGMSRKEVCLISIRMLTSAEESTENAQNIVPLQGSGGKERN